MSIGIPTSDGSDLKPLATGDLAQTPFAHLLLYMQSKLLTGTLVIWPETDDTAEDDRILIVRGELHSATFGQMHSKFEEGASPLLLRKTGPYAFYKDVDLLGEYRVTSTMPLFSLLLSSLRFGAREDKVESTLAELLAKGKELPFKLKAGVDWKKFPWNEKEKIWFEILRIGPTPILPLILHGGLPQPYAKRLVYLLAITQTIEVYKEATNPFNVGITTNHSVAGRPAKSLEDKAKRDLRSFDAMKKSFSEVSSQRMTPELIEKCVSIENKLKAMQDQDHYMMLEVKPEATTEEISKSYYALAKEWHPDRLPPELMMMRGHVQEIFQLITHAQEVLRDPHQRTKYNQNLKAGGGTPNAEKKLAQEVVAAVEFQKAEIMIKKKEWSLALEVIQQALKINANDGAYHGALGYVLFHLGAPDAEVVAPLKKAIELDKSNDQTYYTLALIERKRGNDAVALDYMRKAAKLNPRNLDAIREVRLADMRLADNKPKAPPSKPKEAQPSASSLGSPPKKKEEPKPGILTVLFGDTRKKQS